MNLATHRNGYSVFVLYLVRSNRYYLLCSHLCLVNVFGTLVTVTSSVMLDVTGLKQHHILSKNNFPKRYAYHNFRHRFEVD